MPHAILLFIAGLLAGAINAIAGGGSFVSFPALVFAGLPPVAANASSTVALFPGTVASTWAYRHDVASIGGIRFLLLFPVSIAGGFVGALLLLFTPAHTFDHVIPWLLLLATLTFAFGAQVGAFLGNTLTFDPPVLLMLQFVISIYGGYFGGAVGLIMMAMWGLLTANIDVKAMGPARTLLVSAANGAAVFLFIIAGIVRWPEALAVLFGAVAGGYTGARFARWLPRFAVRICVLWLGSAVTVVFFLRAFGPR